MAGNCAAPWRSGRRRTPSLDDKWSAVNRTPSRRYDRQPQHATSMEAIAMKLTDPKLFRQQCYIDGPWVDADDRGTIAVKNPATAVRLGTVPKIGADDTRRTIQPA